ncbi:class I SAM-dependent methyltransferase fire dancer isoform X1 [Osmia lignaria lignaria]|uniref:class I SAM-dependent methyltransferase fire dancer isoform X1 n=1 Tax=Osmia lignaria lignaria TaxID=1437193 RepID=UPI00402B293D
MSESDVEQVARSVALEQAYVHEVYEQCAEKTVQSKHWPRIYQFLEELEPGALVCDIGCGNGKYLSVNHSIFKVGVDRCKRFTDIAREKENEVLICDNLALPFRDESFDAVLSIAVVHHFATTERRVHALRELARVLRIGGRLVISVWAMEQRHRKFESQDVLIPWPKAYCMNSTPEKSKRSGAPKNASFNQNSQKFLSSSKRNSQPKSKSKGYWIDPIFSPSPSTSSLSSPNETCYSFFRRALQKLAGGRRGSGNRPWFLESWQSGSGKNRKYYEQEEPPDADELPIELRCVEDVNVTLNKQSDSLSIKSKSLGDILEIQRLDLVRSRSSIPGLCSMLTSELNLDGESRTSSSSISGSKPRLVKQKSHLVDDVSLENPDNTAIQELTKDVPDFQVTPTRYSKRGNILKQSSMNEEIMSAERLEEKERVRRNIMKQASLNEDIICKGTTFESFRDSLYSGNATKRFQLLKSGLTNKIRQSTTNIEVSGISIKNGFVKILQGWKSTESDVPPASNNGTPNDETSRTKVNDKIPPVTTTKREVEGVERRLSREDGSDSSKDSSLQSDTSVDSEDSFASVIYVPKPDAQSTIDIIPTSTGHQLGSTSAPPSPRVKYPPDSHNSRLKLISMSPLLKQFPATSKSLPPPSPPGLSPRSLNPVFTRPFFGTTSVIGQQPVAGDKTNATKRIDVSNGAHESADSELQLNKRNVENGVCRRNSFFETKKPTLQAIRAYRSMTETVEVVEEVQTVKDTAPLLPSTEESPDVSVQEKSSYEVGKEEENRKARLNQIKELLKQKPGFATRTKPSFPLVRRASTTASGRLEAVTKVLPRLLSLELFNPETDDLDSDSSGVSSPESVGSVISVISDERYMAKKDNNKSECTESEVLDSSAENVSDPSDMTADESSGYAADSKEDGTKTATDSSSSHSSRIPDSSIVVGSLENVDASSESKIKSSIQMPEVNATWNEELHKHLIDFTENLSENLKHDQYYKKCEFDEDKIGQRNPLVSIRESDKRTDDFHSDSSGVSSSESAALTSTVIPDGRYSVRKDNEKLGNSNKMKTTLEASSKLLAAAANVANSLEDAVETAIQKTHSKQHSGQIAQEPVQTSTSGDVKATAKSSIQLPEMDTTWNEEFRKHLINFTENLGENLMHDRTDQKISDPFVSKTKDESLSKSSRSFKPTKHTKYNDLSDTIAWLSNTNNGFHEHPDKPMESLDVENPMGNKMQRSPSDDAMDFVMVSKSGEFMNEKVNAALEKPPSEKPYLRSANSMESSDMGESISFSSQAESTGRLCSSMVSLLSNNTTEYPKSYAEKRRLQIQRRSASEETPSRYPDDSKRSTDCLVTTTASNHSLSASSSQESLTSDRGGGAITYHQYYHVFREGELDQLINKYVENLHIISSYYDHASWCIVAEKVQVWTI